MKKVILSTVGTGAVLNCVDPSVRSSIVRVTNLKEDELDRDTKQEMDSCLEATRKRLQGNDQKEHKKISPELNGLITYHETIDRVQSGDHLVLLSTDTYLCSKVAKLIEEYLERNFQGCSRDIWTPKNLSTKSRAAFTMGMNQTVVLCEETLPGYRSDGYRIVFNLTGGFKSVQGVMSTLGMMYADEIVYIFETGTELLRMPRLPVVLNIPGLTGAQPDPEVGNSVPLLALLDKVGILPLEVVKKHGFPTPEIFFEVADLDGGKFFVVLMPWGKAVWQRCRENVLGGDLLEWPYIEYSQQFRKDVNDCQDRKLRFQLQDALVTISSQLVSADGNLQALRELTEGMDYSPLKKHRGIFHFHVTDYWRVSCQHSGGKIVLRRFGPRDIVNVNP
jgi:putative CRISPR-associated protein (TIGR02619 family)